MYDIEHYTVKEIEEMMIVSKAYIVYRDTEVKNKKRRDRHSLIKIEALF